MARRQKSSLFDDLIEVSSRLPWWLGVLLAAISYFALHRYATVQPAAPTDMAQMGAYAGQQMWRTMAFFGQYLLPAAFGFGAVIAAIKAFQSRKRYEQTAEIGQRAGLLNMSWPQFEQLVAEHFRRRGYAVSVVGRGGADGGVDVELRKGSELLLVQCKQWRATKVGVDVVRELYGVIAARGASGGYVVSSGQFTADAEAFAQGRNIELVNGEQLIVAMRDGDAAATPTPRLRPAALSASAPAKACPKCGSSMVLRTARQGANAGQQFWGCSTFPKCRGTAVSP
ncbi:restriction endonuclease [Stagnimonas aquatica]|uniref:Restriction endonuclease n=1 Tax=Stagnimonas aquatica TaxID=2689987 RepID=A0A3N0V109_9GAMM|nr:restriction endonuclease [Stagnimonas aquatica]ROH86413.1 restriction endonuclease [Stagnimonas aquatica]